MPGPYHRAGTSMRIILTNPRGFCAGVRMAIDVVDRVVDLYREADHRDGPAERSDAQPVYVYHEIVHNKHVVGRFRGRGVVFVDDLHGVPEGATVVFSAHGVSPVVRAYAERRGLTAIDATCPLVTKVHSEAIRYARQGYQILLVGHPDHQEVIGTRGEAPDAIQVVESPGDIPRLTIRDPAHLVYLTQTTLSTDDAEVIIDALRRAFPLIKSPPSSDICYATTNRQHAVRSVAPECDVVLVVGSKNSSNSVRLTEIARNVGTPAHLLDDASELRDDWFRAGPGAARRPDAGGPVRADSNDLTVLLTAGASAPEDLVAAICRELLARYGGTIETRDIFDEDVDFAHPAALRRMMTDRGLDPGDRGVHLGKPTVTRELYGAVPLTISASHAGEA
ncbi:MAG: 4-hydroxy-3-methylbut-2-enyl diphosphate reductase [Phycisphaerales bacterium]